MEEGVEPFTTYEVKLTTDAMANTSAIFFQIIGERGRKGRDVRERVSVRFLASVVFRLRCEREVLKEGNEEV